MGVRMGAKPRELENIVDELRNALVPLCALPEMIEDMRSTLARPTNEELAQALTDAEESRWRVTALLDELNRKAEAEKKKERA